MHRQRSICLLAFLLLVHLSVVLPAPAQMRTAAAPHSHAHAQLPLTTSSSEARRQFLAGMQNLEELRTADALQNLRAATKADSQFAQAFILIAHFTRDPEEQKNARSTAERLAGHVSGAERLLIRWMAGAQEGNYVPAIAAMNDLLGRYPQDQRLTFWAGAWFLNQQRYGQAILVLERALTLNPDYPAALNELAYAYAYSGDFGKAFGAMDRYVALQPNEPNPHDSYGELLRMAGRFDDALREYRASIRLDPNFGSELGVADTYAVMGNEQDARDEYARAIVFASTDHDKSADELQSALTWIREGNRKEAERSLHDVARHAHKAGLARLEAEANRVRALYDSDYKIATKYLQLAQQSLEEHELSQSDHEDELALIIKVKACRAAETHDMQLAAEAVKQLETMALNSRSEAVQLAWHGAAGAVLMANAKYQDAISHLEEDGSGPESMRLLWQAYEKTGAIDQAKNIAVRLAALNVPTVEQALVVPPFRSALVNQPGQR
jgi:tetratricopeptide (TPR) repeat protein